LKSTWWYGSFSHTKLGWHTHFDNPVISGWNWWFCLHFLNLSTWDRGFNHTKHWWSSQFSYHGSNIYNKFGCEAGVAKFLTLRKLDSFKVHMNWVLFNTKYWWSTL
jgi:hypothetical protein